MDDDAATENLLKWARSLNDPTLAEGIEKAQGALNQALHDAAQARERLWALRVERLRRKTEARP